MTLPNFLRTIAAGAAAALLLGASCSDKIAEPAIEPGSHRLVIIPFKDRLQPSFESDRGIALAQAVAEHLQAKRKELGEGEVIEVVAFEDLVAAVQKRRDKPQDIPLQDLGRAVNADLVLIGELPQFEPKVPNQIGYISGRATVSIQVRETVKPDRAILKQTYTVAFPPDDKSSWGGVAGGTQEEIEAGLILSLTKKIGELFYAHKVDERR